MDWGIMTLPLPSFHTSQLATAGPSLSYCLLWEQCSPETVKYEQWDQGVLQLTCSKLQISLSRAMVT